MHSHARVLSFLLVVCALAACGRKDPATLLAVQPDPPHAASGYLAPPQILSVSGRPDGVIDIVGIATPDSRIRGVTPDRKGYGATAAKNGRFSLEAPLGAAPALIAVSQEDGRRQLEADGWLFVPPDAPSRSVMLRAGAPTRPLQADLVATVDFDAGGGAAISGVTAPGADVDVAVDGGTSVHATGDARGVWSARLAGDKHITPGAHQIRVSSRGQVFDRSLDFTPATLGSGQLYNPVREADGWRIAWSTQGVGVQTTLLLLGAPRS